MMLPWMGLNFTEDDEINNFTGNNEVFFWTRVSTGWWNWLDFGDPEWLHISGEVACDSMPELRDCGVQTSPVMIDGPILICENVDVLMKEMRGEVVHYPGVKEEDDVPAVELGEAMELDEEAGRANRADPVYNSVRGLVEACFADRSDSVSIWLIYLIVVNVNILVYYCFKLFEGVL